MPYSEISELPDKVKRALPKSSDQEKFMATFNGCISDGGTDETCFRIAYSAAHIQPRLAPYKKGRPNALPVGKALVEAKRRLPGWAFAALNTEKFLITKLGGDEKTLATLTDVYRIFSLSRVQKIRGESSHIGASAVYAESIVKNLNNNNLIMKALGEAFDVLPGWAFATLQKAHTPKNRAVVFLCDSEITGKPLEIFKEVYLPLLGNPDYKITTSKCPPSGGVVIGLGKLSAGKSQYSTRLPHPDSIFKFGDSGEIARKARIIKSILDSTPDHVLESNSEPPTQTGSLVEASIHESEPNPINVNISKADTEKKVVTGVVLSPYSKDSQNDILFPGTIEDAAHSWLSSSRTIGLNHAAKAAGAVPVESYLVPYPTREDYVRAMENEPHKAYRFKMGEDIVTSGSWILSTKLNDSLWKDFQDGNFEAYSIGGFGLRTAHESGKIPAVEYGEIGENGQ